MSIFQILGRKYRTEEGFDPKNNTFVLFLCFIGVSTLNKTVTRATTKRLSMICVSENLANTYLLDVTKLQGNGICRFGVLRH